MSDPKVARCLTDPTWRYVKQDDSDIRDTFKRIRKQMKQAQAVKESNVKQLKRKP